MARLTPRLRTFQKKRSGSFKANNANPVLPRLNFHLPSVSVGSGMKIAVTDKNFSFNRNGRIPPPHRVLPKSHFFPFLHPHALFHKPAPKALTPPGFFPFR